MAISVRIADDGFIHTACLRPNCGTRFKIAPPVGRGHFHCPVPGCGCRFAVTRRDPAPMADEPENVWAAVMDAVYAEQAAGLNHDGKARYPRSRPRGRTGLAVSGGAVAAAVLMIGIGLSVGGLVGLASPVGQALVAGPDPESPPPADSEPITQNSPPVADPGLAPGGTRPAPDFRSGPADDRTTDSRPETVRRLIDR